MTAPATHQGRPASVVDPADQMPDDPRRGNNRAVDASKPIEPCIGAVMLDGTVYAGISPDTGKAMYATPADAPLMMTFNEAADYAARLDAHGHKDWRMNSMVLSCKRVETGSRLQDAVIESWVSRSGKPRPAWAKEEVQ